MHAGGHTDGCFSTKSDGPCSPLSYTERCSGIGWNRDSGPVSSAKIKPTRPETAFHQSVGTCMTIGRYRVPSDLESYRWPFLVSIASFRPRQAATRSASHKSAVSLTALFRRQTTPALQKIHTRSPAGFSNEFFRDSSRSVPVFCDARTIKKKHTNFVAPQA